MAGNKKQDFSDIRCPAIRKVLFLIFHSLFNKSQLFPKDEELKNRNSMTGFV